MAYRPRLLTVTMDELEAILARVKAAIDPADHDKLCAAIETLGFLTAALENWKTSLRRLRRMLFGPSTEKTSDVCGEPGQGGGAEGAAAANGEPTTEAPATGEPTTDAGSSGESASVAADGKKKPKRPGHGRNGAEAYTGLPLVKVPHPELKEGECCPKCRRGTLGSDEKPKRLVRLVGYAPISGKRYELERLRCSACRDRFTAPAPEGIGEKKYDESVTATTALDKFGFGRPFQRLERLQGLYGIPFPASTQFGLVAEPYQDLCPVLGSLIRYAAQGEQFHNDDTDARILERQMELQRLAELEDKVERTGTFTSVILSRVGERRVALFFTGANHAGENLARVLTERAAALDPPLLMCDGLERNLPGSLRTVVANCLAHGRRQIVDVASVFPTASREVLRELAKVYANDATAREKKMSPEERLAYHQQHSGPVMAALKARIDADLTSKTVEPNSGLGKAFRYLQKRWDRLTQFLRVAGAPLDNNLAERALKRAILNRKNAMFYKTQFGASVGDLYMSLIHTAELAGANVWEYLVALLRNRKRLAAEPERWMPWNYQETLAALVPGG